MNPMNLIELLGMDEQTFRRRFRRTALWRAKRRGLLRNAAIVLGNRRSAMGRDALIRGLADPDRLVRAACAWALGRYKDAIAASALRARLAQESDEHVRAEIQSSLGESG